MTSNTALKKHFVWNEKPVWNAHTLVSTSLLATAQFEMSMYAMAKDIKARTQIQTLQKRRAEFMTGMIAPPHHSRKRRKLDESRAHEVDLPNEVERVVAVLGKFGEGCVDGKHNTPNIERTDHATWKNIAKAVEHNVGGAFRKSETTVRCPPPPPPQAEPVASC